MRKWLRLVLATFGAGIAVGALLGAGDGYDVWTSLALVCVSLAVAFGGDWP